MTNNTRPVWGADVPVSMPLAPSEDIVVTMYGFGMTQYRLVHNITETEYESLSVPVYQPDDFSQQISYDDAEIDQAGAPTGTP